MSGAPDLDITAARIEQFADRLVDHAGRLGTLSEQTHWQSVAAAQFRERLVQLRVQLRASARQARDGAEAVRRAARGQEAPR
jgi:hypothetical protein